jgi:nicotinate-nucleotide--dimethylbenzimidazole phosphoribosyltransferase
MIQPASLSLSLPANPQESAVSVGTSDLAFEALLLVGVAAGALVETQGGKAIPQTGKIVPDLPAEGRPAAPAEAEELATTAQPPAMTARMPSVGDALRATVDPAGEPLPPRQRPASVAAPLTEQALISEAVDTAPAETAETAEPKAPEAANRVPQGRNMPAVRTTVRSPAMAAEADPATAPAALPVADGEEPQPAIETAKAELTPELPAEPQPLEIAPSAQTLPAAPPVPTQEQTEPRQDRQLAAGIRPLAARLEAPANRSQPEAIAAQAPATASPSAPFPASESAEAPDASPALPRLPASEPARTGLPQPDAAPARPFAAMAEIPAQAVPVAAPPPMPAAGTAAPAAAPRQATAEVKFDVPTAESAATPAPLRAQSPVAANDMPEPAPAAGPARRADAQPANAPDMADRAETLRLPAAPGSPAAPRPAAVPRIAAPLTLEIDLPSRTPAVRAAAVAQPAVASAAPLAPLTLDLPARTVALQLPAIPDAQARIAPEANDAAPAKPAISNELLPSPGQEKRAVVGPGQPDLQGARSFIASSLPNTLMPPQAVAPANLSFPAVDATGANPAPAPIAAPAAAPLPRAHDVSALVDRLVEAREAARGETLHMAVHNKDFGQVSLRFTQDGGALTVAVANDDPDFARAIRSALPAGEARDGTSANQGDRRDFAGSQHGRPTADGQGAGSDEAARRGRSGDSATQPRTRPGASTDSSPQEGATTTAMGGILA